MTKDDGNTSKVFEEVTKEKPKEKPITTRDYYETYSGGCGNTYGGFSRSGGC